MKLNLSNILLKTNKGLDVYQYILNQYFKKEKLEPEGNLCPATRNPFNGGRRSLVVELGPRSACHWDLEKKNFGGTMLDFAGLHFGMQPGNRLYYMINQALELGLEPDPQLRLNTLTSKAEDPEWKPRVSFFQNPISNILPSDRMSIGNICNRIESGAFYWITRQLREIKDPKQARAYKAAHFPYVTFAGVFKRRNDKELLENSELVVFDFDDLEDLKLAKQLLLEDEYFETELLFTSPSGNGLKWVIRHKADITPDRSKFFQGVSSYLKTRYGLIADPSGRDLSRACFLADDDFVSMHVRHWKPFEDVEAEELRVES